MNIRRAAAHTLLTHDIRAPQPLTLHGFSWQVPAESQICVPEQIMPVESSALLTRVLQMPVEPQLRHWPQVALWQHTPSRQVSPG